MTLSGGDTAALGRLAPVSVRDIWPHEGQNFTPWLLANADVLSAVLGMDLELQTAEHPVGDFYLDLAGVVSGTNEKVIVENQLEVSDHGHLGQILTYAGGTDPVNIVWIAPRFRDEHRAAIDWLNTRTNEDTRFFAVELSVVRIGDSRPAPLMKLVSSPNDWEKRVKSVNASAVATGRSALYQQFWSRYLDALHAARLDWTRSTKAPTQYSITLTSGVNAVGLSTAFTSRGLSSEIRSSPNAWCIEI